MIHEVTVIPCSVDGTESGESASMVSLERSECNLEPMETVESASTVSTMIKAVEEEKEGQLKEDITAQEDVVMKESERKEDDEDYQLGFDDLLLLCDVFYLPFEHGTQGMQLLEEFSWLKVNAYLVAGSHTKKFPQDSPEVKEWHDRAKKFDVMSRALNRLFTRLTYINNRELLYELYPYVWDMRGVVALLNSYVKWLGIYYYLFIILFSNINIYLWRLY